MGVFGDFGYYEMWFVYVVRGMDFFVEGGLGGEFMRMLCFEWLRQQLCCLGEVCVFVFMFVLKFMYLV